LESLDHLCAQVEFENGRRDFAPSTVRNSYLMIQLYMLEFPAEICCVSRNGGKLKKGPCQLRPNLFARPSPDTSQSVS
jgi:hypothetical protein